MKRIRNNKGYVDIVEVLIFIAIMGIIAAIVIPAILGQREKTRAIKEQDKIEIIEVKEKAEEIKFQEEKTSEHNKVIKEKKNTNGIRSVIKKLYDGDLLDFDELEIYRNNTSYIDSEVKVYKKLQDKIRED